MVSGHNLLQVVATGQDYRDSRCKLAQGRQRLPTIHMRHDHIAKDETDSVLVLPEHLHSLKAVLCFKYHLQVVVLYPQGVLST